MCVLNGLSFKVCKLCSPCPWVKIKRNKLKLASKAQACYVHGFSTLSFICERQEPFELLLLIFLLQRLQTWWSAWKDSMIFLFILSPHVKKKEADAKWEVALTPWCYSVWSKLKNFTLTFFIVIKYLGQIRLWRDSLKQWLASGRVFFLFAFHFIVCDEERSLVLGNMEGFLLTRSFSGRSWPGWFQKYFHIDVFSSHQL